MRKLQVNSEVSTQQLEIELMRVRRQKRRYFILQKIAAVLLCSFILVAAVMTWFPVLRIGNHAMLPQLESGQWVVAFRTQKFQKGDMIAFSDEEQTIVKRVAACAGDVVEIDQAGNVLINGESWNSEPSGELALNEAAHSYPYRVPEGRAFLMNDNMAASDELDYWNCGSIDLSQSVGKVVFRIWPWAEFGCVE